MVKGLKRSFRNAPPANVPIKKAVIPVDMTLSNIDGATGVGWDTGVVSDFPEGNILFLGATFEGTITKTTANIVATFDGDISFGTAPTADATLNGAEVDIIPSTATPQAVSSVSTVHAVSTGTESGTIFDNTDGSLEINCNLIIDDADIDADNQSVDIDGVLHLSFIVMGDN